MTKEISDPSVLLAKRVQRTISDGLSAKKNQWRVELERAHQVKRTATASKPALDVVSEPPQVNPTARAHPSITETMAGEPPQTGELAQPQNRASRPGMHTVPSSANRSQVTQQTSVAAMPKGLPALYETQVSDTGKLARAAAMLAKYTEYKGGDLQPLRMIWRNGTAHLYILDGVIDESQVDATIRQLRDYFKALSIEVSSVTIGGTERWSNDSRSAEPVTADLRQGDSVINRSY